MKRAVIAGAVLVLIITWGFYQARHAPPPARQAPLPVPPAAAPAAPAVPAPPPAPAQTPAPAPQPAPVQKAAPPAPTTPEAKPSQAAGLTVSRMVIAGAVEDRQPVHVGTTFPKSQDRVYCYLELADVAKDRMITYVWTVGGATEKTTQLVRKAARWRTWGYRSVYGRTGPWKVDVLDDSGGLLGSATFTVE